MGGGTAISGGYRPESPESTTLPASFRWGGDAACHRAFRAREDVERHQVERDPRASSPSRSNASPANLNQFDFFLTAEAMRNEKRHQHEGEICVLRFPANGDCRRDDLVFRFGKPVRRLSSL